MLQSCDPNWDFSTRVISDTFILLCSFVFSQPLYFSYLIFFSPYLLKLFSFLSPLFLTTSLLSLAFLTAFLRDNNFYQKFKDGHNQEILSFDDLGIYETLFGSSVMVVEDTEFPEEKKEEQMEKKLENSSEFSDEKPEEVGEILKKSDDVVVNKVEEEVNSSSGKKSQMEGKRMENFQKILDGFEKMASNAEVKKRPDPSRAPKSVEKQKSELLSVSNGSGAINCNKPNAAKAREEREEEEENRGERKLRAESSRALMAVNGYGSMRREKEWKRTLACKLFEERHNVDGGEGMDSLWEAYEIDSNKTTKHRNETRPKMKTNKKIDFGFIDKCEEEEEEDEVAAPLCCLQALKLSTGKMNLGVGIPNLVKISKAIKGMGWLHSVSKHSKKVHNNNGDRY